MSIKKINIFTSLLLSCTMLMCSCSNGGSDNTSTKAETESSVSQSDDSEISSVNIFAESSSSQDNETPSDITPAMWKVTAEDGTTMTLLGSMHAVKDSDYPLPKQITDAYNNADVLAVECDTTDFENDINAKYALMSQMKYSDGTKLKDVISKDAYKGVLHMAEQYGIQEKQLEDMKPWAVQNTIDGMSTSGTDIKTSNAIDGYFLKLAHEKNKEIYQVESVQSQFDMLMNFSTDIYNMIFEGYNSQTKESNAKSNEELYQAWRKGDLKTLEKMSTEAESVDGSEIPKSEMTVFDDYTNQMLYSRNIVMEKAVKKLLKEKKNVFYVVGAAHYVGDKGIISLLEKDGYKVERLEYK